MNTIEYLSKPLFSITVGEFLELQKAAQTPVVTDYTEKPEKYVYGMQGLADIFKCSKNTAGAIKGSGILDKAISQVGKKIVVDKELALEAYRLYKTRKTAGRH